MTPAQLEHLKLIDAHCAKRIAFYGNGQHFPAIPSCLTQDAEAGWRATRAAIAQCLEMQEAVEMWKGMKEVTRGLHMLRFACDAVAASILAAFPLESLKP